MKEIRHQRFYETRVREIAESLGIELTPNQYVTLYPKGSETDPDVEPIDGAVTLIVTETKT